MDRYRSGRSLPLSTSSRTTITVLLYNNTCYNSANLSRSCYDSADMVTVRVKDEALQTKDYKFHRQLLAFHSAFFATALDPQTWARNRNKVIEVNGSHDVWDVFNFWVYSRGGLMDRPAPNAPYKDRYLSGELLYRMWVFADFYWIPDLSNTVIDMLHESLLSRRTFPVDIEFVYANTRPGSKLREFVLNWYVWWAELDMIRENDAIKPTIEFMQDLLVLKAQQYPVYNWYQRTGFDRCEWHDHRGPGGRLRYEARR